MHTEATNIDQSCIMVSTSGTMAGVVLGEWGASSSVMRFGTRRSLPAYWCDPRCATLCSQACH